MKQVSLGLAGLSLIYTNYQNVKAICNVFISWKWSQTNLKSYHFCFIAEETGVDLGQKKDSYFYSCCHNNWCWGAGQEVFAFPQLESNLEMLESCNSSMNVVPNHKKENQTNSLYFVGYVSFFLLCHNELRAARLWGRGSSTAGWWGT